jgi:anti-sigma factor RsiW
MTAEKYILGELSAAERDRFEEHYFECGECADAVRSLSHLRDATRAGLYPAPQSATARETRKWFQSWRTSWFGPQAAVAFAAVTMAVVTGYQNVQLRSQLQPQVLQSVTLQPASRGQIASISPQTAGAFVLIEADVPGASGNLTWTVRADDGKIAATGTGAAPEAGLSLKVLVPAKTLPASDYSFDVRSDSGKEWLFRFRAGAR